MKRGDPPASPPRGGKREKAMATSTVVPALTHPIVTEEEFLSLPETMQKMELVDGEVRMPPSPTFWHQDVAKELTIELSVWARAQSNPVTVCSSPLDVRFAPGRILQPDVFVVFGKIPRDHKGPIDRIPDLCIEVLSSDRVYDRVTKRLLYAEAGVKEFWVVDPARYVERFSGERLKSSEILQQVLTSALLPGFELDLSKLFAG